MFVMTAFIGCKNYRVVEPDFDKSSTEYFVQVTDDASLAANLPILRHLPLDDELKEIRIWVGFGPLILQQFYSINLSDKVSGKFIWYFDSGLKQWEEQDYKEFYNELYQTCDKLGVHNEIEACVDTEYVFDWNALYNELVELDIWNIPDESEVPKYVNKDLIVSLDGTTVVVELKKPGYYRSFSHKYERVVYKDKYLYGNKILEILQKHVK